MYKISQRRYLGNKNRILDFIAEIIKTEVGEFNSLCDIFSGTGVVGEYFNAQNKKIISNDLLYNNYVSLNAFLNPEPFNEVKLLKIIDDFNKLEVEEDNYFSDNFGARYFYKKVAKKIFYIRENIKEIYVNNSTNKKYKLR